MPCNQHNAWQMIRRVYHKVYEIIAALQQKWDTRRTQVCLLTKFGDVCTLWHSTMFRFSVALHLQGLPALKTAHLKNFTFRNKDNRDLQDCRGRLYRYKSWLRRHLDCCHATMLQPCNLEVLDISSVFHWPKEVTTFHGMLLRLHTLACPLHHVYSMVSLTVITLAQTLYWWYLIYLLCSCNA